MPFAPAFPAQLCAELGQRDISVARSDAKMLPKRRIATLNRRMHAIFRRNLGALLPQAHAGNCRSPIVFSQSAKWQVISGID